MNATSAILVRHAAYAQPADVPSAWLPHELLPKGFDQAKTGARAIVEYCEREGLTLDTRVESSTLLRAWQTANTMAKEFEALVGVPFRVSEWHDLAERGVGAAANLTIDEIEELLDRDPRYAVPPAGWKASGDYRLPFPGAESLREAGFRVARFLRASLAELNRRQHDHGTNDEHEEKVVRIFVGHGAAFRWASVALGVLDEDRLADLSMHYCGWVHVRPGPQSWDKLGGAWKYRATGEAITD
ncbi:MAG: histidine phosphatase family protein [Planctomycetes bacterium]|nr:histidine phosphatase family protein [Planctomycetota bacterium]